MGYVVRKFTSIGFEFYLSVVLVICLYLIVPKRSNKLINSISDRSYGIYLFHSPLIYLTATYCPNINPRLMLLLNLGLFGGMAYYITVLLSNSSLRFVLGEKIK